MVNKDELKFIASYVRLITCLSLHRNFGNEIKQMWKRCDTKTYWVTILYLWWCITSLESLPLWNPSHPKYAIKLIFPKDLKLPSKEPEFTSVKQISWLLDAWLGICSWWSRAGNFGSFLDLLQKMLKNPFRKTTFSSMYQISWLLDILLLARQTTLFWGIIETYACSGW